MRRHHPARSAPRRPEVHDQGQVIARNMLVEARRAQLERMAIEQQRAAFRAVRCFGSAIARHAHDGVAFHADDVDGIAHAASVCWAQCAGYARKMRADSLYCKSYCRFVAGRRAGRHE